MGMLKSGDEAYLAQSSKLTVNDLNQAFAYKKWGATIGRAPFS